MIGIPLPPALVGPRLTVRFLEDTDAAALRTLVRDNDSALRPWQRAPEPGEARDSLMHALKTIARERDMHQNGSAAALVIADRESAALVGRVALTGIMRGGFLNAYLGYWIDHRVQKRGYATEAVTLALGYAFGPLNLHRVQAAVMPRNIASLRVLDKVGMRREGLAERYLCIAGVWEDHALYAMTAEEWPTIAPSSAK